MRVHILTVIVALLLSPLAYGAALFELHGILSASGVNVRSQPSWLNGGFGRLDVGADRADDNKTVGLAFAQIGGDAYLTNWLSLHANTVARVEQPGYEGDRVGVIEAYADITPIETDRHRLRLRTGSYANWPVVAFAAAGNLLPDFPLVNKSFELCYACADR